MFTGLQTVGAGAVGGALLASHGISMGVVAATDMGVSISKLYKLNASCTAASSATSPSSPSSNGETSATKRGRDAHDNYNSGKRYEVDRRQNRLRDGTIPDAIDFKREIVRELKPTNPRKIRERTNQVKKYLK